VAFTVDSAGDEDGLALLCAGLVDVAGSTRSPTPAEAGACRQAGIDLVELRYASASLVVATSRDNDETGCLSFVDLYALLGGRSAGFSRWSDAADLASELGLDATRYPDAELVVAGPSPAEPLSGLLRQVVLSDVAGDAGLPDSIRSDLDPSDPDAIVDALAGSQASIGWLPFPTVSSNAGRVRAIPLSQRPGEECVRPTTETIADGTYPASVPLLLHAGLDPDRPDRDLSATRSFVGFMLDDAYRASVTSEARFNGYVPLPPDQLDETVDRWANT
jgi:ABC-type phosphate transport system substrate-binding protein